MKGFTTDTISEPLRVVWSHEVSETRERIGKEWKEKRIESDWFWATPMNKSMAPEQTIYRFGHDRRKIENEGYNELATNWHADPFFHHHANSIEVLWLVLFMAYAVFHCFYRRNLKPALKADHTVIFFARQMAASVRAENWWPPP